MDRLAERAAEVPGREEGAVGRRLRAAREQGAATTAIPRPTSSRPTAATVAQELFVFTLGGEGRRELERVVASDYSSAQIDVKLRSMSSDVVLELIERTDALATEIFAGTGITATTTGSGRLFSTLDHYLVESQISSFGTAFFTVFAVIFVVFRSVALRVPDDRAEPAAGARGARRDGVPRHLDEHRDRDGRQRRARHRGRRHDPFHQPLPARGRGRRDDRRGDRDRHRARGARVADDRDHQQPRASACCCCPSTSRRRGSAGCSA